MKRLGVDVGGTFTDLIYVDDEAGQILVHKLPTTPDDPSRGTVQGIRELTGLAGTEPSQLEQARNAMEAMERREHFGKIVLNCGSGR